MKRILLYVIVIVCVLSCYTGKQNELDDKLCPRCNSDSIARIVYGLVSPEERNNWDSLKTELKKKREILGGCCVMPEKNYCYKCGYKW